MILFLAQLMKSEHNSRRRVKSRGVSLVVAGIAVRIRVVLVRGTYTSTCHTTFLDFLTFPRICTFRSLLFHIVNRRAVMKASLIRLATATSAGAGSALRPAPLALLPPIQLYRRLLRAHRYRLTPDERILGDQYVKSEFRAHRHVENPMHIVGFLTEWQLYAQVSCNLENHITTTKLTYPIAGIGRRQLERWQDGQGQV
jgi:hypothetical protein